MKIALNIKKVRESLDFSQEYVAKRLGMTQSAYCKMERNEGRISVEDINKIASIMGIEPMLLIKAE